MTTAQYLFQTNVNPDVVYKAYLKWLRMLTLSGGRARSPDRVREVPVARVQLRRTRPRTAAQPID